MLLAGDTLYVAGPTDHANRRTTRGFLWAVSSTDGSVTHRVKLPRPPALDGLAAAGGRLYLTTDDGRVFSLGQGD